MRGIVLTLGLGSLAVAAGLLLASGSAVAEGNKAGKHPHFADGGVLPWSTSFAAAKKAAKKSGKLILVEYGREA